MLQHIQKTLNAWLEDGLRQLSDVHLLYLNIQVTESFIQNITGWFYIQTIFPKETIIPCLSRGHYMYNLRYIFKNSPWNLYT